MRSCSVRAAVVLSVLLAAGVARAQTVDEIVAKTVEAKGGAAKWKTIDTVQMTGKVVIHPAGGLEGGITLLLKRPNQSRQDVVIKNVTVTQAFDGTTGWAVNPMAPTGPAPVEMPAQMVEAMKQKDFDGPLVDYKTKGHTVELVGKEKLADADVYHLKVTLKTGMVQHYFIDAASGNELKTTEDVPDPSGAKVSMVTELSKYQAVNGVQMPFVVKQTVDGKPVVDIMLEKIDFNTAVPDDAFKMPKK
jgi:outer membrane lipoprotein-sorting protein